MCWKNSNRRINVSDLVKRLIEQVAFEARSNEYVDKKSGVSARLTIAAFENADEQCRTQGNYT